MELVVQSISKREYSATKEQELNCSNGLYLKIPSSKTDNGVKAGL